MAELAMVEVTTRSTRETKWSADREYGKLMLAALGAVIFVVLGVVCASFSNDVARSVGVIIVTAATGGIGGAAIGFLFGIPRVLSDPPATATAVGTPSPDNATSVTADADAATGPAIPRRLLASNSNLEQVSDWLTKIILGVGLTQFYQLDDALFRFEQLIARFLPAPAVAEASTTAAGAAAAATPAIDKAVSLTPLIATIVLVFSVICGFLTMYLETRLVLSRIFNSVELILRDLMKALEAAQAKQERSQARADGLETVVRSIADAPRNSATTLVSAADSLKSVASAAEASPELRSIAAQALAASGRTNEATDLIPTGDQASIRDRISAMQVALYKDPPEGYREVLAIAGSLSNMPEARANAEYWFYQAAAFGQQHHYLLAQPAGPARDGELASARDNALDSLKRTLAIDASYKLRFAWLMNPAQSPTPTDDDLADFGADPDFLAAVA